MQYKKLKIENFRGIENIQINDFKQINLFVGENNCGKTTILEALFLITGISNPQLPMTINQLRGLNYLFGDDKDHLLVYHKLDYENIISIETEGIDNERLLKISPHKQVGNDEITTTFEKKELEKISLNSLSKNQSVDGYNYEITITKKGKKEQHKASIFPTGLIYHQEIPKNYKETINATLVNPVNVLNQLPQNLNTLIKTKRIDKVVKVLQKIDISILNIIVGTDNLIYCDTGLNQLIPINVMGDGIRRILSLIVTVANFPNGCVLIDEIENGFHYKSIEVMWKAIFETSKEFNVQIFATTHSMECVKGFYNSYIYDKHPEDNNEIRLYRLERQNNILVSKLFDPEMLKIAIENNWEVR
jgi:AAA15 family ATPase/GTPase